MPKQAFGTDYMFLGILCKFSLHNYKTKISEKSAFFKKRLTFQWPQSYEQYPVISGHDGIFLPATCPPLYFRRVSGAAGWQAPFMAQPAHPQPQDDFPFLLPRTILTMTAATTRTKTALMMIVAIFPIIHVSICGSSHIYAVIWLFSVSW